MNKETVEILEIYDFLSINHIKWEIEDFNIITGDMGSGKSLCIKLVQFFEDIIPNLLVLPYESFLAHLNSDVFFKFLIDEFNKIFVFSASDHARLPSFKILYSFSYKTEVFSITITGTNEANITVESSFLETLLADWGELSRTKTSEEVTPDGFKEIKLSYYNDLLKKFGSHFPIATTFVPASRAALAFASNHTDNYLKEYKELVDVLPRFISSHHKIIDTILKARIKIKDGIYLESDDGRKVPIAKASSGQQEIVYVLLLLDKLGNFQYTYGKHHSLFIEEPSAHLFPQGQKQTIELIVRMYNYLKDIGNPVRFFITTHSPYILNSLNNMLKKGALLAKYKEQAEKINETITIPYLHADEVSAFFINNVDSGEETSAVNNWESMLDEEKKYLYSDKILGISTAINEDTETLRELNNELLSERE